MTMKPRMFFALATVAALLYGLALFAQAPVVNIDRNRHGNLWAAQKAIVEAFQKIDQAQKANNDKLGGHAQQAKDLLVQANEELKLAAQYANNH
jgi:F0F1-type ATP synthase membrane subunit b/b'